MKQRNALPKFVLGGSRGYPNESPASHPGFPIRWRGPRRYQAFYGSRWHNIDAVAFYD